MTVQSLEGEITLPSKKCLFPIRNDGNTTDNGKTHWGRTQLCTCTLKAVGIIPSSSCKASCPNQDKEPNWSPKAQQKDPLCFLATVWALILCEYAEVDIVQIGVCQTPGPLTAGNAAKQSMKLFSSAPSQMGSISELFHLEGWSVSSVSQSHYPYFNTGLAIYQGQHEKPGTDAGENWIAGDLGKASEGEEEKQCAIMLALDLENSEWSLEYNTSVLSSGQADHMASLLTEVVTTVASKTTSKSKFPEMAITSSSQQKTIKEWNGQVLSQPSAPTIHQIIHNLSNSQGDHPALLAADGELTYAELDASSSRLARHLQTLGVNPGTFIPVCFNKSLWAVVTMLAINKAGAAFVTLDASQPLSRLRLIVKQLNDPPLGLTSPQNQELMGQLITQTLAVDAQTILTLTKKEKGEAEDKSYSDWPIVPTAPSYCFFTSGSTGEPKGCLVDHAALASVQTHCQALHLNPTSRVLQFASFSFGVSLIEIWCALAAGGTVCMPSDSDRVSRLADAIESMKINWAFVTPTVLGTIDPDAVPGLRHIMVAGEPLKKAQISLWAKRTRLFQAYGFTEWAGVCCVSPQIHSIADIGIIGTPANARCWLIEPGNPHRIAPIGAVAELFVEGPSLAQGYLNNPEKTTLSFLKAPAWRQDELLVGVGELSYGGGVRGYRTGDLAYYDSNGLLRYVSRQDRQVKVRGQRIDLGEPEFHVAQASPLFRKAVIDAIVPADNNGVATLVAFVEAPSSYTTPIPSTDKNSFFTMPDQEFVATAQQVIEALEEKLPDVMIPRLFVQIQSMPLTVTGKIDRRRLRQEAEELRQDELLAWTGVVIAALEPPQTVHELLIHHLVVELLNLAPTQVGMEHNFFALGGDSVKAMKMVSRARAAGVELTATHIFAASNLGDLALIAAELGQAKSSETDSNEPFVLLDAQSKPELITFAASVCGVEAAQIENMYPCTPLQEGMVALSVSKPGAYIARFIHRLEPHVDIGSLRRAWEAVVQACPIMRTRMVTDPDGSRMFQVVLRESFLWDDMNSDIEVNWDMYMKPQPTDALLFGAPLVHAGILAGSDSASFESDPSASYFVVMMHHCICDRWASGLMMNLLEKAYVGDCLVTNSMAPFIQYLSDQLASPKTEQYWKLQFQNLAAEVFPSLPFPGYTPVPSASIHLSIPCQRDAPGGYTMSNVIRLAWAMVISQYTSSPDVVFGVTVSGRAAPVADIEEMVAPIIATVPLRVRFSPEDTIIAALEGIQNQSSEMVAFEQFGLQRIRKVSQEADDGCSFQSQLIVQPSWADENRPLLNTLEAGSSVVGGFASWALSVICSLTDSREVNVTMEFDPNVISVPGVERISKHFEQVLQFLLTEPSLAIGKVPCISSMDMQQLHQWSGPTSSSRGNYECVHNIIQQRCVEQPTANAVWAWDGKLTYAELDQLSTSLAAELINTCEVEAGVIVPICMEKSLWTTVAILAIIKAGGAFVLLDSSQPQERLETICRRVKARSIVTSPSKVELARTLVAVAVVVAQDQSKSWPPTARFTPTVAAQPSSTLYIAFTSGSTGTPKGVIIDHWAFCSSALALNTATEVTSQSRLLQFAGYSFDGSIMETLSVLMAGGCLCVPSNFEARNELGAAARKFRLTHAHLTPSLARHILVNVPDFTEILVSVGEPLTPSDVADWAGNNPKCRVMNGYGPAECAVSTTIQPCIKTDSNPQNIGFPLAGVCCFVVHPESYEILLPIGAVGELLVEGPTVARGYLDDPVQTEGAFISSPPSWLRIMRPEGPYGRLYKTGDLVRYNSDGSLQYVGRRDAQVKLRGQRIELGEVENHVRQSWLEIDQVAVEMVTSKISSSSSTKSLVAFVVPADVAANSTNGAGDDTIVLINPPPPLFKAQVEVARLELQNRMPLYMIPEIFLPVRYLPQNISGKLDRRRLRDLAERCSLEQLALYRVDAEKGSGRAPTSDAERTLHEVWAHVLNRPSEEFGVDDNFYHLGGDSITAMQIVAQARFKGLRVTLDEIMRHKTISQIILHSEQCTAGSAAVYGEQYDEQEELDTFFDLSPIQLMFLDQQPDGTGVNRFNQTFLLRLTQPMSLDTLRAALDMIHSRHSMLRARFARLPDDGRWMQKILPPGTRETHYHCASHQLNSRSEIGTVTAASTNLINIEKGPLTAVNLIDITDDGSQHVFLAIHHLVVDLVSWRIILADLNALLAGEDLAHETDSISFQIWCRRQAQFAHSSLSPEAALPLPLPEHYHEDSREFWFNSADQSNSMGHTQTQSFTVDQKTTQSLFKAARVAYDCQPVEVLHAGLLYSFLKAFPARSAPIIFNEGHGREPWEPTINLAQTVGWFTTAWPVVIAANLELDRDNFHHILRLVKDARRAVPRKGWAYFTSRYLSPDGQRAFKQGHPMEIIFNYAGEFQQLEHANALFATESHEDQGALDAGDDIQRFGIFEIGASVQNGSLRVQLVYPRQIQHANLIDTWVKSYKATLEGAASQLQIASQKKNHTRYTLSDFPLLPSLTYPQLQELVLTTLPTMGISMENVEEIYPCSPSQHGMLIAQAKAAHSYNASVTWKIQSASDGKCRAADPQRLYAAYSQVIQRHAALRTMFIDSPRSGSYMEQLVLRHVPTEAVVSHTTLSGSNPSLPVALSEGFAKGQLMHRMNLCQWNHNGEEEVMIRLDMSHAIMDRTTMQIIERDLCLAYEGKLSPSRGPLFSDYVDYIERQDGEADSSYWQNYLQDIEPCLFPSINGDKNTSSEEWGNASHMFDHSSLGEGTIEGFCRRHNVTMWNLAGLAWALVLRSFTNSDHICFGYVKSGRDLPIDGIEDAVGAIFNPLTCRVSFDGDLTVQDSISQLQKEYLDSLQHQCFPLTKAHRLAGVVDGSLFNTSVAVQSGQILQEGGRALDFTTLAMEDGAEDDLIVSLIPGSDSTTVDLRFKTCVLSQQQAHSVVATFEKAIRSILTAENDSPIAALEILSEYDFDQIWARNQSLPLRVESSVHGIVHERFLEYPDSEAICDTNGSFTYRELDDLASRLAQHLIVKCGGMAPNEVVPICMEKSRWTPVAMLGVLKAGGTLLLLDTSYPQQRRMEICSEVQARIVVSSSTHASMSNELASTVVLVGPDHCTWNEDSRNDEIYRNVRLPIVQPEHGLYVVFTSGSTGKPKGVVIDHGSYCTGARGHIEAAKLTRHSRVTQFCSYAFDMSMVEQLSVLMAGGCICVISDEQRKNNFGEVASTLNANFAILVPSVARLFRTEELATIKSIMLAGECMTQTDVSFWAPHVHLINGYGPAECSALSVVQPSISATSDPRNIGYPVGCVLWVADRNDHHKLVPQGAIGELLIEGPIVGRGYINQPERTAEAFIEPPAWLQALRPQTNSTRLYKTGDLVRSNADGSLLVLGRKDRQVKVRGQRLELAEVEVHVHRSFDGVARDVVTQIIVPAGTTKSQLVAMILLQEHNHHAGVPNGNDPQILEAPSDTFAEQLAAAEIRLRQQVPDYMVPAIFLPVANMPRTQSGKVDQNRLRNLITSMPLDKLHAYRASSSLSSSLAGKQLSTDAERELANIWATVLDIPIGTISASDNFFFRGGHSIDAMKASALGRAAGMSFGVADIFDHPVLSELASVAVAKDSTESKSWEPFSLSPIKDPQALHKELCSKNVIPVTSTLEDLLPATQAQHVFIKRGTFHSYNWTIKGRSLNMDRLRETCQSLVDRHSILRTSFVEHEGHPIQLVLANLDVKVREVQCWPGEDPMEVCKALWDGKDWPTLNVLGGSLPVRFTLVSCPGNEHVVLTIQISHSQWDGVSIPKLFSDFAAIYNQTPLPPTSDFAHYLYHRVSSAREDVQQDPTFQFWRHYLDGAKMAVPFAPRALTLCAEPAAAAQSGQTLWTFKGIVPPTLPSGITMATLVKAATALFLSYHLGSRDVVFGHTVNGRNLPMDNIESLLGCTLNFVPLRVTFPEDSTDWTVMDLLHHTQTQYTRALSHEHVELRDIFQHSTNWPAETPLSLIVQHQNIDLSFSLPLRGSSVSGDGEDDSSLDVQYSKFARFDPLDEVWIFTEPHADRLEVQVCANSRVLGQEQATELANNISAIITKFSTDPTARLLDITF
uniref:TqaA n=2 Tax=Penicillium aethiopicum TaxID=36650 RepID=F1CWE4_PENAE|nr:TqaA [Penicillium aethiopicum]